MYTEEAFCSHHAYLLLFEIFNQLTVRLVYIVLRKIYKFAIHSFAKAQHTRYGTVILFYHVMKLHAMASTLLDILGHSYGLNLQTIKEIHLVYLFS